MNESPSRISPLTQPEGTDIQRPMTFSRITHDPPVMGGQHVERIGKQTA